MILKLVQNITLLKLSVFLAALVPVAAGAGGIMIGPSLLGEGPGSAELESHFRYLSGLLLAIGLVFWSLLPAIEEKGSIFKLLTFIVVTGGLARLLYVFINQSFEGHILFALIMELVCTPLLCLWQHHAQRKHERPDLHKTA